MAEALRDDVHWHARGEQDRGVTVPEVMKPDPWQRIVKDGGGRKRWQRLGLAAEGDDSRYVP